MAIADIDMSSCGKVALCLGYTLLKFGTNSLSSVENRKVLLQHFNLSVRFRDILIFHFWLLHVCTEYWTNFRTCFLFLCNFDLVISYLKKPRSFPTTNVQIITSKPENV